jgi:hypothetical protein
MTLSANFFDGGALRDYVQSSVCDDVAKYAATSDEQYGVYCCNAWPIRISPTIWV